MGMDRTNGMAFVPVRGRKRRSRGEHFRVKDNF